MPTLLKADAIISNDWQLLEGDLPAAAELPAGKLLLPLAYWQANRNTLTAAEVGVWVPTDAEPEDFAADLPAIQLLGIRFGAFNDGRGLSLAALLRTRYGYQGELRALGAVHEDLLHYMRRCGIDSFLLPDGANVEAAQRNYRLIATPYQGSVVEPQPLFRRSAR